MRGIAKKNTWTKENCIIFAKTCSTKKEFRENRGAYEAAMKNGCLKEINKFLKSEKSFGTKGSKKSLSCN